MTMCKLLLALACSVCACHARRVPVHSKAARGTAKRLSETSHMSKAQVSDPSSVLASLVLALRPETAFSPSASAATPCPGKSSASGARPETFALTNNQVLLSRVQPCRLEAKEEPEEELADWQIIDEERQKEIDALFGVKDADRTLTEEEKQEQAREEEERQAAIAAIDANIEAMLEGAAERVLKPKAEAKPGMIDPGMLNLGRGGLMSDGLPDLRPTRFGYAKVKQVAPNSYEAIEADRKRKVREMEEKEWREMRRNISIREGNTPAISMDRMIINQYNRELREKQEAEINGTDGNVTQEMSGLPWRFNKIERKDLMKMTSQVVYDPISAARLPVSATIVVVGASSALGKKVVQALTGEKLYYELKCLVRSSDTGVDFGEKCSTIDIKDTYNTEAVLNDADAIIFITNKVSEGGVGIDTLNRLLKELKKGAKVRRLVTTSIHGVERSKTDFAFSMQNLFGQLDKESEMEQEVVLRAIKEFPSYSVLRIGGLDDDDEVPSLEAPSSRVALAPGDKLKGAVPISTAASVLAQSLTRIEAINATLSIGEALRVDAEGASATDEDYWQDQFSKALGPDIFRKSISVKPRFLRQWAQKFLEEGEQLSSPVKLQDVKDGVMLRFLTRKSGYSQGVKISSGKGYKATVDSSAGKPDGALLFLAEAYPSKRVRVVRAEMEKSTIVKLGSEETLLTKLDIDLEAEAKRQKE